jgi:plastocyanin
MVQTTKQAPGKGILVSDVLLAIGAFALLAIVVAAIWLAVDGSSSPPKRKLLRQTPVVSTELQVDVQVIDNDYQPRVLSVIKGATVTWKFAGSIPHTVTDDRGAFDSGIHVKGDEFSRTFDASGVFYYYCTIHHGMLGTLTVSEQAPSP